MTSATGNGASGASSLFDSWKARKGCTQLESERGLHLDRRAEVAMREQVIGGDGLLKGYREYSGPEWSEGARCAGCWRAEKARTALLCHKRVRRKYSLCAFSLAQTERRVRLECANFCAPSARPVRHSGPAKCKRAPLARASVCATLRSRAPLFGTQSQGGGAFVKRS